MLVDGFIDIVHVVLESFTFLTALIKTATRNLCWFDTIDDSLTAGTDEKQFSRAK